MTHDAQHEHSAGSAAVGALVGLGVAMIVMGLALYAALDPDVPVAVGIAIFLSFGPVVVIATVAGARVFSGGAQPRVPGPAVDDETSRQRSNQSASSV